MPAVAAPRCSVTSPVVPLGPLLAAAIVLLPLPIGAILWATDDAGAGDPNLRVSVSPYAVPLAAVLLLGVGLARRGVWALLAGSTGARRALWIGAAAWVGVALLNQPSWRGLDLSLHAAAAVVVAVFLACARRDHALAVVSVVIASATAQAALAIAQAVRGDTFGLDGLESPTPLRLVGGQAAGRGSFLHEYHLTIFLMVGIAAAHVAWAATDRRGARAALLAGSCLMSGAAALTFSRTAVLAVIAIVVAALPIRDLRPLAGCAALAFVLAIVPSADAWSERGQTSVDAQDLDSGRRDRLEEAGRLVASAPLLGVGPGRYAIALQSVDHALLLPAHNLVAQAAAETGIPGGLLTLGLVAHVASIGVRGRPAGPVVLVALLPFQLLDAFLHVYPSGVVLSGTWLGLLLMCRRGRPLSEPAPLASGP